MNTTARIAGLAQQTKINDFEKTMDMNTTNIYRNRLAHLLESKAGMNDGQISSVLDRYDKLKSANASDETSFAILYESFGSSDTQKEIRTIKDFIEKHLGDWVATQKLEVNPIQKWKAYLKRFNANLDACSVELDGKPALTKAELDRIRPKIPAVLNPPTAFTATASDRNLIVEILI